MKIDIDLLKMCLKWFFIYGLGYWTLILLNLNNFVIGILFGSIMTNIFIDMRNKYEKN